MTTLDPNTRDKGTDGPFEAWEGDHTAFAHVLWAARREGLTLESNTDAIVSMLLNSRAMAARTAEAVERRDHEVERANFLFRADGADEAAAIYQKDADDTRARLAAGGHSPEHADGLRARASRNDRRAQDSRDLAIELREQAG